MGIDGLEWQGGRDDANQRKMRRKIIAQLGSNIFKVGMYKCMPGGQAINYVVMFKVVCGVSMTHESVQACPKEADVNFPLYTRDKR